MPMSSNVNPMSSNVNPLQYSCLENSMGRGAQCGLQSMGSPKTQKQLRTHTHPPIYVEIHKDRSSFGIAFLPLFVYKLFINSPSISHSKNKQTKKVFQLP